MDNDIQILYKKLEEFITKYYLFKIFKGILILVGSYLLVLLVQSIVEYFNYLSVSVKTVLFYSTSICATILLIYYFLIPISELFKLRKPISYLGASKIIGKHFPEIKDKLLNTLELDQILHSNSQFHDLLLASINQRTDSLLPLPFKQAINFKQIKNYLVFFSISIFILLFVFVINSEVVNKGTFRLLNYSRYYEPEAPFDFLVINKKLICEKNKDFTLLLKIKGKYIPQNVYINIEGNTFLMQNDKLLGQYFFVFRNVNNSFSFNFVSDNFKSKPYNIEVLAAPS